MSKLFLIQLISSFFVGGGIIALISLLAEKASARMAGIILAFPSTVALGFFFLAWAVSPEAVSSIVPATLIPLGLAVLFPVVYVFIAQKVQSIIQNKIWQIVASFTISAVSWSLLTLPFVLYKFSNLAVGLAGYALLISLASYILHRKSVKKPVSLTYTLGQKIGRATFVGFIITLITFLSKTMNPFWGGVLAAFPAAYSSMLMLLHWYYGAKSLLPVVQKVPIGSISIVMYALTAMIIFPKVGFIQGTLFAYIVSLITSTLLAKLNK